MSGEVRRVPLLRGGGEGTERPVTEPRVVRHDWFGFSVLLHGGFQDHRFTVAQHGRHAHVARRGRVRVSPLSVFQGVHVGEGTAVGVAGAGRVTWAERAAASAGAAVLRRTGADARVDTRLGRAGDVAGVGASERRLHDAAGRRDVRRHSDAARDVQRTRFLDFRVRLLPNLKGTKRTSS